MDLSYKTTKEMGSNLTWIRTGGEVEVFRPDSILELKSFVKSGVDYFPLGMGSNTIIKDTNLDKVILKLDNLYKEIELEYPYIIVGSGVPNFTVSRFCIQNFLGGLEFLHTIPGSIGGGVFMNAGAYGSCFSDNLEWVEVMDIFGSVSKLYKKEIKFSYRKCHVPKTFIFLRACFKVFKDEKIKEKVDGYVVSRNLTQPRFLTLGSTFKNPEGKKAWELIDQAGCRGFAIGGAKMSEKHCNFIVNTGGATSGDIVKLINSVQSFVFSKTGILLDREIVLL
ncbi:UDP-N-acetylmuramate dehydrogenase [Candidatus Nesciobacter abundans]|uniref:UDP-N-acetylenolpyruvoylglucosamine reductase n=1 Tax=Candidatus Nesciobacter abundans TaxID=2601668 RepID=A0A5C0UFH6_9PROT|nr:UDP-N-acetylmuramate dehydrogenase [Candidatus Nesciobacter abundans]QEK38845.1 UDP-N-acetylmuramate dehydrogenase [Candidatus Nesciobacter abundans]